MEKRNLEDGDWENKEKRLWFNEEKQRHLGTYLRTKMYK